jgi:hypothetical protein
MERICISTQTHYSGDSKMSNIYYSPEDFGLKIVNSIDFDEDYGFDMIVVWETLEGDKRLYWATDSGCSCPSPFEDFHSFDMLEPLNRHTWDNFERAVMSGYNGRTADKEAFIRQVKKEYRLIK